jgi:hypothetical protein
MITPVVVGTVSTRRSMADDPSAKSRRPAPQYERPGLGHARSHHAAHDLIVVAQRPTTVLEIAARILVGSGRRLHHTIKRHVVHNHNPAHLELLAPRR